MTYLVDINLIISIIVTMLFSAFFSGMEIAYVSNNRMLSEMTGDSSSLSHRLINYFYQHPNTYVSTMLVGNNIALVIYGILIAKLFDATIFQSLPTTFTVPADTILSTIIVLFTGEYLPKTIFKNNATTLLRAFALPAAICYIILYPLSRLCTIISRSLLKVLGVKVQERKGKATEKEEFSKVELGYIVQHSVSSTNDDNQAATMGDNQQEDHEAATKRIFKNALELSDTQVRDCMIPRTEITAVDRNTTLEELKQKFIESGRTKIIVYDDDIDNITGYIHSSELFRINDTPWQSHIRQTSYVPETMAARKLMQHLLMHKTNIAVVVDEFGGTSGLVSLEDILEEITGEIEDEHDKNTYLCRKTDDGAYVISARLEIPYINSTLQLSLPTNDAYKTLGGLILQQLQAFPKLNQTISIPPYECRVIKTTNTRIELVKLRISSQDE